MKALILVLSLLLTTPALADTRVVEGDIIEMDGETIRIMGLATPKTWRWQPKCLAGKMLGLRARAYAQELVPRIESIEEHGKDQNGQILARVVLDDGMDWAEAMIERGLAVPFECPDGKCTPLTNTKGH